MPLILLTGFPSSGKSKRTSELKSFFEGVNKVVHIVSEYATIQSMGIAKNQLLLDSSKEKQLRALIKAEVQRLLGREEVIIVDAANYIKGYRYEFYCTSKTSKTTQCTVHCEIPIEVAWQFNTKRPEEEQYTKEVFDALVMRYEPPETRNRWDSPLFLVMPSDSLQMDNIFSVLFERKAPPPNQSTQCAPLSSTNFLYECDQVTQEIVRAIISAQKLGLEEVKIPGHNSTIQLSSSLTAPQLTRLRRQFLAYTKLHPSNDTTKIASLFVQFLNSSIR